MPKKIPHITQYLMDMSDDKILEVAKAFLEWNETGYIPEGSIIEDLRDNHMDDTPGGGIIMLQGVIGIEMARRFVNESEDKK